MATDKVEVIGGAANFWLYSKTNVYDLTHPPTPNSPPILPRLSLETTTGLATIDPAKTDSDGLKTRDKLLEHAIPACRKAGIAVVWLGWGLTDQDIEEMPPTIIKGFAADTDFEDDRKVGGLGSELVSLDIGNGKVIEGGRVLMRDQWNTALYPRLVHAAEPQDIGVYKNRLSGFWGGTGIEKALADRGIKTLMFSGVNTDQCVGVSLQDAFTKGWDCLMLSDGCATTSPEFCKKCIEFN